MAEDKALVKTDRQEALEDMGLTDEDLTFQVREDGPLQLHPQFAARIAEQLQFDGDIPELRTGPLPEGATPAVPVKTGSRSAIAVGMQLAEASEGNVLAKASEDIAGVTVTAVSVSESYKTGHKAQAVPVAVPKGQQLLVLAREEEQKYAFKAITSTQGRRSLAPVLGDLVREELGAAFLEGSGDEEFIYDLFIPSGALDFNPRFSFVDLASKSLKAQILRHYGDQKVALKVRAYADVPRRRFGWRAEVALDTKTRS